MAKFTIHASVTASRVLELVEQQHSSLDNPGICLACGDDAYDCEPDAERYECESCERRTVYGVEQILLCGYHHP